MFNFIRDLLSFKRNKNQTDINTDDNDTICSIEIQMNNDGTINIICGWPDFNEKTKTQIPQVAYNYALIIDALANGMLSSEIYNTLKNHVEHKPFDILFVQNVIYKLAEIKYLKQKNSKKYNEPAIKPTEVFKQIHQE
jgi:hypothetical protein